MGAEFIIKENILEQNFPPIINVSACVKGKWKAISPPPNFEEIKRGGNNFFMVIKEFLTFNNIYFLEVNWYYCYISRVIAWVYNNNKFIYVYIFS